MKARQTHKQARYMNVEHPNDEVNVLDAEITQNNGIG